MKGKKWRVGERGCGGVDEKKMMKDLGGRHYEGEKWRRRHRNLKRTKKIRQGEEDQEERRKTRREDVVEEVKR